MQGNTKTLRHETLAHFGLNLLGSADKATVLADIVHAKRDSGIGAIFNQVKKACPEMVSDKFRQSGMESY